MARAKAMEAVESIFSDRIETKHLSDQFLISSLVDLIVKRELDRLGLGVQAVPEHQMLLLSPSIIGNLNRNTLDIAEVPGYLTKLIESAIAELPESGILDRLESGTADGNCQLKFKFNV